MIFPQKIRYKFTPRQNAAPHGLRDTFADNHRQGSDGCGLGNGNTGWLFLKRRCRLWKITPDSQRLTKYAAHLDCFKPGRMCIIPTQHPDIQQLSHHHCTSTSKTFRHNLPPRAVSTTAAFSTIHCHCGTGRNDECGSKRPWWRCAFPAASTTAAFSTILCRCGRK